MSHRIPRTASLPEILRRWQLRGYTSGERSPAQAVTMSRSPSRPIAASEVVEWPIGLGIVNLGDVRRTLHVQNDGIGPGKPASQGGFPHLPGPTVEDSALLFLHFRLNVSWNLC